MPTGKHDHHRKGTGHYRRKRGPGELASGYDFLGDEQMTELVARKQLLDQIKAGDMEAVEKYRKTYRMLTLCIDRRYYLLNGVAVRC